MLLNRIILLQHSVDFVGGTCTVCCVLRRRLSWEWPAFFASALLRARPCARSFRAARTHRGAQAPQDNESHRRRPAAPQRKTVAERKEALAKSKELQKELSSQ